jgi:hypothetical protein
MGGNFCGKSVIYPKNTKLASIGSALYTKITGLEWRRDLVEVEGLAGAANLWFERGNGV